MELTDVLTLVILFFANFYSSEATQTELNTLDAAGKLLKFVNEHSGVDTKLAENDNIFYAEDTGYSNPGDLIYRFRESNDVLQIREVIVLPEISSDVQEVQWYASTTARRITTVRVLNFGRDRAYTVRIDVAGNEAQVILRIPSNYDPRIMIEVYGY